MKKGTMQKFAGSSKKECMKTGGLDTGLILKMLINKGHVIHFQV